MELTISTTIVAAAVIIMAIAATFYTATLGVRNIMDMQHMAKNKKEDEKK